MSLNIFRQHRWLLFCCCCCLLITSACSFSQAQSTAEEEYQPVRSPYPTFTPTSAALLPLGPENSDGDVQSAGETGSVATTPAGQNEVVPVEPTAVPVAEAPVDEPTATVAPTLEAPTSVPTAAPPRIVVDSPLVNVRAGPGVEYPILSTVERGEEFDIVGKNAAGDWWRFCCVNSEPAWVIDELVAAEGAVDSVPVSDAVAQVPATAIPLPVADTPVPAAPAEPAPTEPPPAPAFGFDLQNAEQFPENKVVRVFLYVFDSEQALAGYSVRVVKDGGELPVSQTSAGGQPSLSWPIADARQRFQNMKVEFPGVAPAGTWEVQLVDGSGNPVGPAATFTLDGNDTNQELYVRYKKL